MSYNPVCLENLQHNNSIASVERAERVRQTAAYLQKFPHIKAREVARKLGVNERSAYRYLFEVRAMLSREEGK